MDIDDTLNNSLVPANDKPSDADVPITQDGLTTETSSLWQRPELMVPLVGWCALCTYWLWQGLPFWLALPAGCVLGIMLFVFAVVLNWQGGTTLKIGCAGSIGLVLAFLWLPVLSQARERVKRTTCIDNVKTMSQALLMYSSNNSGHLPPGSGWEATIRPFLPARLVKKGREIESPIRCPLAFVGSGYALYQTLIGRDITKLNRPEISPLVFDADVNTIVAVGTLWQLPESGRHSQGNVIGFADGHVRWEKPAETIAAVPTRRMSYKTKSTGRTKAHQP